MNAEEEPTTINPFFLKQQSPQRRKSHKQQQETRKTVERESDANKKGFVRQWSKKTQEWLSDSEEDKREIQQQQNIAEDLNQLELVLKHPSLIHHTSDIVVEHLDQDWPMSSSSNWTNEITSNKNQQHEVWAE